MDHSESGAASLSRRSRGQTDSRYIRLGSASLRLPVDGRHRLRYLRCHHSTGSSPLPVDNAAPRIVALAASPHRSTLFCPPPRVAGNRVLHRASCSVFHGATVHRRHSGSTCGKCWVRNRNPDGHFSLEKKDRKGEQGVAGYRRQSAPPA